MQADALFILLMGVMTAMVIRSVVLVARGRGARATLGARQDSFEFKDCYDLCPNDPKEGDFQSCATMCRSYSSK
jgi:hypothetical protein